MQKAKRTCVSTPNMKEKEQIDRAKKQKDTFSKQHIKGKHLHTLASFHLLFSCFAFRSLLSFRLLVSLLVSLCLFD